MSLCQSTEPLGPDFDCNNLIGIQPTHRPFALNTSVSIVQDNKCIQLFIEGALEHIKQGSFFSARAIRVDKNLGI